jgi:hypothetical protein
VVPLIAPVPFAMMASRTDAELVEFSGRLLHEVQVFFHVSRALIRWRLGLSRPLPWETEMALVESFALHTRALSDFFYVPQRGRHRDNAFAFDFFDSPQGWQRVAPSQGAWLSGIKRSAPKAQDRVDRFGEQLGHLTFKQPAVSDYARGWPVAQVASEIGVALRAFVEAVPDAKVGPDFKQKAWRELPAVVRIPDERKTVGLWARPVVTRRLGARPDVV